VSFTDATPELLVRAMTFVPVKTLSLPTCTFVNVPALVVKKTLAPAIVPPDEPGLSVTLRLVGNTVPAVPLWPSPAGIFASPAADLATSTHPLSVVETPTPSVAGTEKE
jgi:hypothetical protein